MTQGHIRGRGSGAEEMLGILSINYPHNTYISTCTNIKHELMHKHPQRTIRHNYSQSRTTN